MTLKIKTKQQGTQFQVSSSDNTYATDENCEVVLTGLAEGVDVTYDNGTDKVVVITVVDLD